MGIGFLFKNTREPYTRKEFALVKWIYRGCLLVWLGIAIFIVAFFTGPIAKILVLLLWMTLYPGGWFRRYDAYLEWHREQEEAIQRLHSHEREHPE